ncbi:hypothetical protein H0W26_00825, partial [Candidatus Dependentiae bacterium]|nr:hypothetical protein [Candidatus Dependentiae bacterium]
MKLLLNLLLCLSFWGACTALPAKAKSRPDLVSNKLLMDIPIRVLLEEKSATTHLNWKLECPQAFFLFLPEKKQKKTAFQSSVAAITYQMGSFYINGARQNANHFFIVPLKGGISFRGNSFDGIFAVTHTNGICYLVNHLDIEEYVLSVIPHESVQGWPAEVQKAFCIGFRSYGISKVLERRALQEKNSKVVAYDIKNTNAHQV